MTQISVSSFNLRYDTPNDGERRFLSGRCDYVAEYLLRAGADVIGLQELNDPMRTFLEPAIAEKYSLAGSGREADYTGEGTPVAYRRDKFRLLALDQFWLSVTPGIPGSRPGGMRIPRICTVVTLLPLGTATPLRFYNTHLYHICEESMRFFGVSVILERIRRDTQLSPCPVVLTGDFNARPDSVAVSAIRDYPSVPLVEASFGVGPTYHEYHNPALEPFQIDYIWTDAAIVPGSAARVTERRADGMFLSDHDPIIAEIRF